MHRGIDRSYTASQSADQTLFEGRTVPVKNPNCAAKTAKIV